LAVQKVIAKKNGSGGHGWNDEWRMTNEEGMSKPE
jgi:hypothetical protein